MLVYIITNKINGKIYIGQTTKTLNQRLKKHLNEATYEASENSKRCPTLFHDELLKVGIKNFEIKPLDRAASLEELYKKEDYYIKLFNSTDPQIGYNSMMGGISGKKLAKTKELISQIKRDLWSNPEVRERGIQNMKKAQLIAMENMKNRRVPYVCPICKKEMSLPAHIIRDKKYCSRKCAGIVSQGLSIANAINAEKIKKEDAIKKLFIEQFAQQHVSEIINCKYNNLEILKKLQHEFYNEFGIVDLRSVGRSYAGKQINNKTFLSLLKDYVKRYAEPDWNQPVIMRETSGSRG